MRSLTRVMANAAGRGQAHKRRVHLARVETLSGGIEYLGRTLCGSEPQMGFSPAWEVYRVWPAEADCPRCAARLKDDDVISNPRPETP